MSNIPTNIDNVINEFVQGVNNIIWILCTWRL